MKLNTPSERFFVFMATVMLFGVGYQHYFNYQTDKRINNEMEKQNILVGRYCARNHQLGKENTGLKIDMVKLKSEIEELEKIKRMWLGKRPKYAPNGDRSFPTNK